MRRGVMSSGSSIDNLYIREQFPLPFSCGSLIICYTSNFTVRCNRRMDLIFVGKGSPDRAFAFYSTRAASESGAMADVSYHGLSGVRAPNTDRSIVFRSLRDLQSKQSWRLKHLRKWACEYLDGYVAPHSH